MTQFPHLYEGGELELVVLSLDPVCFETLTDEPDFNDLKEEGRRLFGEMHSSNLKIMNFLERYGSTRQEIIDNIKSHLDSCDRCKQDYCRTVDKLAEQHLRWAKNKGVMDSRTAPEAEKVLEQGYLEQIKKQDILGYLKQSRNFPDYQGYENSC